MKTSRIHGFHRLEVDERIEYVKNFSDLTDEEADLLHHSFDIISKEYADRLIENCICGNPLIGVITNAKINGKDYLIPVSIEEPSIVAAASRAFKLSGEEGVEAESLGNYIRGQVQITELNDLKKTMGLLKENEKEIMKIANEGHRYTKVKYLEFEEFDDNILLYLIVDTGDIQGANTINRMCEAVSEYVEDLTSGEVIARIVSNYGDKCLVRGRMKIEKNNLPRNNFSSEEVIKRFLKVSELGERGNVYRASTNNKGIMNGVIGVANATGQDTRAIYTAAEAYATRDGKYSSLSKWYEDDEYLVGEIIMPMPVGIIGGATDHPYYKLGLKILGVESSQELQEVIVSVGLANNFSAIQEISTTGITKGHMRLHQRRFG